MLGPEKATSSGWGAVEALPTPSFFSAIHQNLRGKQSFLGRLVVALARRIRLSRVRGASCNGTIAPACRAQEKDFICRSPGNSRAGARRPHPDKNFRLKKICPSRRKLLGFAPASLQASNLGATLLSAKAQTERPEGFQSCARRANRNHRAHIEMCPRASNSAPKPND